MLRAKPLLMSKKPLGGHQIKMRPRKEEEEEEAASFFVAPVSSRSSTTDTAPAGLTEPEPEPKNHASSHPKHMKIKCQLRGFPLWRRTMHSLPWYSCQSASFFD